MPRNKASKISVSAIIVTKNESQKIIKCLESLLRFDEVVVVDSNSNDGTIDIAKNMGVRVKNFVWDGEYPKKRQWCLDNIELRHDWVFFVDADEVVTSFIIDEIAALFEGGEPEEAGFFVTSRYSWKRKQLRFGLHNKKLVLFDRRRIEFPVVDDLGLPGMGEIEGHYQPVLRDQFAADLIGQLQGKMLHNITDDMASWTERHLRYARWEVGMNIRSAWPVDPVPWRQFLKQVFRKMPMRNVAAFLHCYVFKLGFLDGLAGLDFALSRARYYSMIAAASKPRTG